jgi:hypothetical protein
VNKSMYLVVGITALGAFACSGGPGSPTYLERGNREPVVDGREASGSGVASGSTSTDSDGAPTSPGPTTPSSNDNCVKLGACCPTLPEAVEQCNQIATANNEKVCDSTLKRIKEAGYCK